MVLILLIVACASLPDPTYDVSCWDTNDKVLYTGTCIGRPVVYDNEYSCTHGWGHRTILLSLPSGGGCSILEQNTVK